MNQEFRRVHRHPIAELVPVTDTMTDHVVGQLGNLSETGMLLIANKALVDDALYQFRFNLSVPGEPITTIEAGAHVLWQEQESASGQTWIGLRFITLLDSQLTQLQRWLQLNRAKSGFAARR
ncbi:PilZ domain-containing protein [Montanilutibacter psychrotolerans]|uniref:PilZ domain-containing protein n=1 Tax=Montanilutibacter psychrotolerans TaxID=1327343 RepID=A0A3M8SYH7_9GAMM|nr:PilZ domain-containing protein [Lysobacter psychrotolerans]RNF85883.1 PilZ domain-containing protein [Lysobacter psychrotolerans]